jgi:hypothetical protein
LTINDVLCRKSTDLSWDGNEPSAAVAEEDSMPATEESAPLPQAEIAVPVVEATLHRRSLPRVIVVALGKLIPRIFC